MCWMLVFPAKTETVAETKSKADDDDDDDGEEIKMMIKNCVNIYKIPIYKYVSKIWQRSLVVVIVVLMLNV